MQPDFKIILNDNDDVTAAVQDYLITLSVTDSIDERSDACQIVLADPDQTLALPSKNGKVNVHMGYRGQGLQDMGSFFINEVVLSGTPDTMTINADSANLSNVLKEPKQRNWNGRTLGAIVATIAEESRSEAAVQEELQSFFFDKLSQDNESDHQFLRRVALMTNAIYKPGGRKLAMIKHDSLTSVSGKPLSPVTLPFNQLISWDYRNPDRALFDTVRTWWHDEWAGQYKEIFVALSEAGRYEVTEKSPGGSVYTVRNYYATKDSAVAEAKSILQRLKKNTEQLSLSLPGDVRLLCEVPVTITGGRPEFNRRWIVAEAGHNLSASGYLTDVVLSPVIEVWRKTRSL